MHGLAPCPICGRMPKMTFGAIDDTGCGETRLECRRWFRTHCSATAVEWFYVDSVRNAGKAWNAEARRIKAETEEA